MRYYLIKNLPEKKDSNFTINDFKSVYNADIVNKFSNFVNRTLNFKELECIKYSGCDEFIIKKINDSYDTIANQFEKFEFRNALGAINSLITEANYIMTK